MPAVLLTCFSQSWGGMEMFTLTTAQQLRAAGITVHIATLHNCRLAQEAKSADFCLHTLPKNAFLNPPALFRFSQFITASQIGLIHAQASKDLWVLSVLFAVSPIKLPLLFTKHVGSYIVKKDLLHQFAYRNVTMAFGVSNVIAKNLADTTPLPPHKISVLHNGVDLTRFIFSEESRKKIRNQWHAAEDTIVFGMTARFSPGKGHEVFIDAARNAIAKKQNLLFIIVGEASRGEDEYASRIKNLAARANIPVIFTGYRTDIPAVLSALDVFVFPSHAEAFGIALIEAMAIGLPTIVTAADGALDIAVDSVTSLMFERGNTETLTQNMLRLAENNAERESLGKAGNTRALTCFSLNSYTAKLLAHYSDFGVLIGNGG